MDAIAPTPSDEAIRERLLAGLGGVERFVRSFDARSHYSERVAERALVDAVAYFRQGSAAVLKAGGDAAMAAVWQDRLVSKWLAYQAAGSRVMNWFVTGPARFPVERNQKRMATERARCEEMLAHVNGAAEWTRRRLRGAQRAALSEAAKDVAHPEREVCGVRLVQNAPLDRVQLIFPGRPSPEVVAELKSRAFRWSPREGAWQRQLTRNGMWAAEAVLKSISEKAA